ncbi:MAG: zinc-ribbon domain [Actinomycetota bacterium]
MNFCSNCAMKLEPNWKVCPGCGSPIVVAVDKVVDQSGTVENPQVIRIQRENLDRTDRDKITSRANVLSMTSMWLSIAGLIFVVFGGAGVFFSIGGVICGRIAQKNVREAQGSESSYAKVGVVVGYMGIALSLIVLIIAAVTVGVGLSYLNSIQ